jgi:hypothetical protein
MQLARTSLGGPTDEVALRTRSPRWSAAAEQTFVVGDGQVVAVEPEVPEGQSKISSESQSHSPCRMACHDQP